MLHFSMRVHLSAGGCRKLSLQWAKLDFYRKLLPEIGFFFYLRTRTRKKVCASQSLWADGYLPSSYPAFLSPVLSLQMVLCIRSRWTQCVVICHSAGVVGTNEKQNFWHLISAALVCSMRLISVRLSKRVIPSNQVASQHLKLHHLLTKQWHTPVSSEVPWGHPYIKTRIIMPYSLLISSFYCLLWAVAD